MSEGLVKHHYANILCFLFKSCHVNVGGVNYRILGMLKFDKI